MRSTASVLVLVGLVSGCLPPGEDGAPDPTAGDGVPQRTPLDPDIVRGIYRVELTYGDDDCAPVDAALLTSVRARVDRFPEAIEIEYPHRLPDDPLGFEVRRRVVLGDGPWTNVEDLFTFCPERPQDNSVQGELEISAAEPDEDGFAFEVAETYDSPCSPPPSPPQGCNWSATGRYVLEEACPSDCRLRRMAFDPTGWSLSCECA